MPVRGQALVAQALRHAKRNSTQKMVEETIALYKKGSIHLGKYKKSYGKAALGGTARSGGRKWRRRDTFGRFA